LNQGIPILRKGFILNWVEISLTLENRPNAHNSTLAVKRFEPRQKNFGVDVLKELFQKSYKFYTLKEGHERF